MPADTTTLFGLGIAAALVLWLLFSVMKKMIGLVVLAGLALAAFILWTNPGLLQALMGLAAGR